MLSADLVMSSFELVRAFRAAHGYPLNQVRTLLAHHASRAADGKDSIQRTHSPYFTTGTTREIVDRFLSAIE
ncbi:MAG: hypothetical protein V9E83_04445 [Baekduia sp.]